MDLTWWCNASQIMLKSYNNVFRKCNYNKDNQIVYKRIKEINKIKYINKILN